MGQTPSSEPEISEEESKKASLVFTNELLMALPSAIIQIRDGNKTDCVPFPGTTSGAALYKLIVKQPGFKEFLFRNLDNEYLISSILTKNLSDDALLTKGIPHLNKLSEEESESLKKNNDEFEDAVCAGVDLEASEILEVCHNSLQSTSIIERSPFFSSFQKRLALIQNLKDSTVVALEEAHEQYRSRIYNDQSNDLTSFRYPELALTESLKDAGVHLLNVFHMCYPLLSKEGDSQMMTAQKSALCQPVTQLCGEMKALADLALFPCWAPAQQAPQVAIKFNPTTVYASSGAANLAIDGRSSTSWVSKNLRATWSVKFMEPAFLSILEICWSPGASVPMGVIPKHVVISVKFVNNGEAMSDGEDDEESSSDWKEVLTVYPSESPPNASNNWISKYDFQSVEEMHNKQVKAISLRFTKQGGKDLDKQMKVIKISCIAVTEKQAKWVNTLETLLSFQQALLPLLRFDVLKEDTAAASVALVRSSGSLRMLLKLMNYLIDLDTEARAEGIEENVSESFFEVANSNGKQVQKLFSVITKEVYALRRRVKSSAFTILNYVKFSNKSAGITISEEGSRIQRGNVSGSSSNRAADYAFLDMKMTKGVYVWELSFVHLSKNNAAFGVADPNVTNAGEYESSADMYMISPHAGKLYHAGSTETLGVVITTNDVCQLKYDAENMTLSLAVNGNDMGVIFESVPTSVAPVVVLGSDKESVRLLQVMHKLLSDESVDHSGKEKEDLKNTENNTQDMNGSAAGSEKGGDLEEIGIPSRTSSFLDGTLVENEIFQEMHHEALAILEDGNSDAPPAFIRTHSQAKEDTRMQLLMLVTTLAKLRCDELESFSPAEIADLTQKKGVDGTTILEYPFCADVSAEVVTELVTLLVKYAKDSTDERLGDDKEHSMYRAEVLSTLRILDAQFYCLTKSRVHLKELGLSSKSTKADKKEEYELNPVIREAAEITLQFLKSKNPLIKAEAAKVYARGSSLFLPSIVDKIGFIVNLVEKEGKEDMLTATGAIRILLEIIIEQLSSVENVLQIIEYIRGASEGDENLQKLHKFINFLLETTSVYCKMLLEAKEDHLDKDQEACHASVCSVLARFQEHLMFQVVTAGEQLKRVQSQVNVIALVDSVVAIKEEVVKKEENLNRFTTALKWYYEGLATTSHGIVSNITKYSTGKASLSASLLEACLRKSMFASLMQPFLHALCFCVGDLGICQILLPITLRVLHFLSQACRNNPIYREAKKQLYQSLSRSHPYPSMDWSGDGEENAVTSEGGWQTLKCRFEEYNSYNLEEDGTIYASTSSGNSTGVVDIAFGNNDRAAWEFELLHDAYGDECSLFGAARKPLQSRSYTDSPDLFMRRAYNGALYNQGHVRRITSSKIHQGDIVRIEFDGVAGTLSYGINGAEPEVLFTDIENCEISPACGSYRSGVRVKLLKVEAFRVASASKKGWDAGSIEWAVEEAYANELAMNTLKLPKSKTGDDLESLTAVANNYVYRGVHDWTFEVLEKSFAPYAVGVRIGQKNTDPRVLLGKTITHDEEDAGKVYCELAWYSDGTLWVNGEQKASDFGSTFLPLQRLSAVTMRADIQEGTLSFSVDGELVGVAFGPAGSGAVVEIQFADKINKDSGNVMRPAASITNESQQLKIMNSGFHRSLVMPLAVVMHKAAASVYGRLAACMLKGDDVDDNERRVIPWLNSPLFIGGLEDPSALTSPSNAPIQTSLDSDWEYQVQLSRRVYDNMGMSTPVVTPPVSPKRTGGTLPSNGSSESSATADNTLGFSSPNTRDQESRTFLSRLADSWRQEGGMDIYTTLFMDWLERIAPDPIPANMKAMLIKRGTYSYPRCEMPYVSCLLKHGMLVQEAMKVFAVIKTCVGEDVASANLQTVQDRCKEVGVLPVPSRDMQALWHRFKRFRKSLQSRQNQYKQEQMGDPFYASPFPVLDDAAVATSGATSGGDASNMSRDFDSGILSKCTEEFWGDQEQIRWSFPDQAYSVFDDESDEFDLGRLSEYLIVAEVLRVGIDFEECSVFLYVCMTIQEEDFDGFDPEADDPDSTKISNNNEINFTVTECVHIRDPQQAGDTPFAEGARYFYLMRFDVDAAFITSILEPTTSQCLNFNFQCTNNGDGTWLKTSISTLPTRLELNNPDGDEGKDGEQNAENKDAAVVKPSNFEEYCDVIVTRTQLLLDICAAMDGGSEDRKTSLLDLMEKYASNDIRPARLRRLRSHDGQERWRRVMDFLRVHTDIRRKVSHSSVDYQASATSVGGNIELEDLDDLDVLPAPPAALRRTPSYQSSTDGGSHSPSRGKVSDGFEESLQQAMDGLDEFEEITPSSAAMQACGLFLTIEDYSITPHSVEKAYKNRLNRASRRIYALKAMQKVLAFEDIVVDPFCLEELLHFIKMALVPAISKRNKESDVENEEEIFLNMFDAYYLTNLEGCDASTLSAVQSAFLGFYDTISVLISQYVGSWERNAKALSRDSPSHKNGEKEAASVDSIGPPLFPSSDLSTLEVDVNGSPHVALNALKMMLSVSVLNYSSRDHRFVLQTGIVESLYKMLSLSGFEKVVQASYQSAEKLLQFSREFDSIYPGVRPWKFWSSIDVVKLIENGDVTCRNILLHLMLMPSSEITIFKSVTKEEDKESLFSKLDGLLSNSFADTTRKYNVPMVTFLFQQVYHMFKLKEDKIKAEAADRERLLKACRKHLEDKFYAQLKGGGIVDPGFVGEGLTISNSRQVLSMDRRAKPKARKEPYAGYLDVEYIFANGPEATGNYFEIEVLKLGDRAIGIGMAVKDTFPVSKQMVGWVSHSYGYHGDDGRKFGDHATSGSFPLFENGDVIGCGLDFERRAIWYTRNGELLGDGFVGVGENKLWPVLSFVNRNDGAASVKVNFGMNPFRYESPNVIPNPKALSMRLGNNAALLELINSSEFGSKSITELRDCMITFDVEVPAEVGELCTSDKKSDDDATECAHNTAVVEQTRVNEKEPESKEWYLKEFRRLYDNYDAALCYEYEMTSIRQHVLLILRFVLCITCRNESDVAQGRVSRVVVGADTAPEELVEDLDAIKTPALMRGMSSYGTPASETATESKALEESVASVIIQQLLLGATYMNECLDEEAPNGFAVSDLFDHVGQGVSCMLSMGKVRPNSVDSSINALQEKQLGLETTSTLSTDDDYDSNNIDASIPVLEMVELEAIMYSHLVTLASLSNTTDNLKQELSNDKFVKCLCILLHSGSNRMKSIVCSMLRKILPTMPPEESPSLLSHKMQDMLSRADGNLALLEKNVSHKITTRKMPDCLIRSLLLNIKDVLQVGTSIPEAYDHLRAALPSYAGMEGGAINLIPDTSADLYNIMLPHGVGTEALKFADQNIEILQSLFEAEASQWTELVACTMTDALRNACSVVRAIDEETVRDGTFSEAENDVIYMACAACAVLSGLGTMHRGAMVTVTGSASTGALISNVSSDQQVRILLNTNRESSKQKHSLKDVESVSLDKVEPLSKSVNIDIANLTQPLYQQLTSLLKVVLKQFAVGGYDKDSSSSLLRLSSVISTSIATLFSREPDLMMHATFDKDIISSVFAIAMMPTGIECFPHANRLVTRWNHTQGRVLENVSLMQAGITRRKSRGMSLVDGNSSKSSPLLKTRKSLEGLEDKESLSGEDTSKKESVAADTKDDNESEGEGCAIVVSASDRSEHERMAQVLVDETGVDKAVVLALLEFYMMDMERTRSELAVIKSTSELPSFSAIPWSSHDEEESVGDKTVVAEVEDEDNSLPAALVGTSATEVEEGGSSTGPTEESLGDIVDCHDLRDENDAVSSPTEELSKLSLDDARYSAIGLERLVSSMTEEQCAFSSKTGMYFYRKDSTMTTDKDESGGDKGDGSIYGALGTCMRGLETETRPDMVLSFYNKELGTNYYDCIENEKLLHVVTFFNKRPDKHTAQLLEGPHDRYQTPQETMYDVDRAMAILRIRHIAAKLVMDSSASIASGYVHVDNWMNLLKLAATTASDKESLSSLCNALLSKAQVDSEATTTSATPSEDDDTAAAISDDLSEEEMRSINTVIVSSSSKKADKRRGKERASRLISKNYHKLENGIIAALIRDCKRNFLELTQTSKLLNRSYRMARVVTNGGDKSRDQSSESIYFRSPHPYHAPCISEGCIEVPEHWRGMVIKFHPKCRTANDDAMLRFYDSLESFEAKSASSLSLYGEFKDVLGDTLDYYTSARRLYYRFNCASVEGMMPPLMMLESKDKDKHVGDKDDANTLPREEEEEEEEEEDENDISFAFTRLFQEKLSGALTGRGKQQVFDCPSLVGTYYFEVQVKVSESEGRAPSYIGVFATSIDNKEEDAESSPIVLAKFDCNGKISSCDDSLVCTAAKEGEKVSGDETMATDIPWESGDVLGCVFSCEYENPDVSADDLGKGYLLIRFLRNGNWMDECIHKISDGGHSIRGLRPVLYTSNSNQVNLTHKCGPKGFTNDDGIIDQGLEVGGTTSLLAFRQSCGLDDVDNRYNGHLWKPLILRDLLRSKPSKVQRQESYLAHAWGYEFTVEPMCELKLNICRAFNEVGQMKINKGSDSGRTASNDQSVWVWRPKFNSGSNPDYCSIGDVISTTKTPPVGCVVIHKNMCKSPVKFYKVAVCTTGSSPVTTIWRPVPPEGYVSMGDVLGGNSTPSMDTCSCVPAWAVHRSRASRRLLTSKVSSEKQTSYSVWDTGTSLGTFMGSPSNEKISGTSESSDGIKGIGTPYDFNANISSVLLGEWLNESDVLKMPSKTWSTQIFQFLMENERTADRVLTPSTFSILVQHVQSDTCPMPLGAVPSLISMIREAQKRDIDLPLDQIDALCKVILTKALNKSQGTSGGTKQLSLTLSSLVDLVVEVQAAQVAKVTRKELHVFTGTPIIKAFRKSQKKGKGTSEEDSLQGGRTTPSIQEIGEDGVDTYLIPTKLERRNTEEFCFDSLDDVEQGAIALPPTPPSLSGDNDGRKKGGVVVDTTMVDSVIIDTIQSGSQIPGKGKLPCSFHDFFHDVNTDDSSDLQIQEWYELTHDESGSVWYKQQPSTGSTMTIDIEKESPIKPEKIKGIFSKVNILRGLRQVLTFLNALGVNKTTKDKEQDMLKYGQVFMPSYPKLMTSKVWHEFSSRTSFYESQHPYIVNPQDFITEKELGNTFEGGLDQALEDNDALFDKIMYRKQKTISWPGATKLTVLLDRRTTLGVGASLTFQEPRPGGKTVVLNMLNVEDNDSFLDSLNEGLHFQGDSLCVTFTVCGESIEALPQNPKNSWGWAFVVTASEDVFETVSENLELVPEGVHLLNGGFGDFTANTPYWSNITEQAASISEANFGTDGAVLKASSASMRYISKRGKGGEILTAHTKEPLLFKEVDGANYTAIDGNLISMGPVYTETESMTLLPVRKIIRQGQISIPFAESTELTIDWKNFVKLWEEQRNEEAEKSEENTDGNKDRGHDQRLDRLTVEIELEYFDEGKTKKTITCNRPAKKDDDKDTDKEGENAAVVHSEVIKISGIGAKYTIATYLNNDYEVNDNAKADDVIEDAANTAEGSGGGQALDPNDPHGITQLVEMDAGWTCDVCTLYNEKASLECAVCMSPNPNPPSGAAAIDTGASTEGSVGQAGWWCTACTFVNRMEVGSCEVCGTQREGDVPAPINNAPTTEGGETETAKPPADKTKILEQNHATSLPRGVLPFHNSDKKENMITFKLQSLKDGGSHTGLSDEGRFRSRLIQAAAGDESMIRPKELLQYMSRWTPEADAILLEYLDKLTVSDPDRKLFAPDAKWNDLVLPRKLLQYSSSSILDNYNLYEILNRLKLLGSFNTCLEDLLPIVNLKNNDRFSVGAMIRNCSRYVFMSLKSPILRSHLHSTAATSGPNLPASMLLNNMQALNSREKGEVEPSNSQCCFVQAFNQIGARENAIYRYIFSEDRVFQINFHGESGIDAGGVFREGVSAMTQDLFSDYFNLFILCPNGQHETHINCDKFVPNPKHTGPLALQMYEFVGKMMGCSLRAKLMLPFEFPAIVWKKLCGNDIVFEDLRGFDAISCHLIEALENCEKDEITDQEAFAATYKKLKWTYTGSDGVQRELVEGGASRNVLYSEKGEYCEAVVLARFNEFNQQIEAIERGMAEVVPIRTLQLFTWQQLEILVAGDPKIDIELWKQKTDTRSISSNTAKLFWKVMESLTNEERSGFIRFAWGRSRLPPPKEFTSPMRLTRGDGALPIAHTCFFHIELPEYSTEEEMRHALLTCIHFGCGGVLVS